MERRRHPRYATHLPVHVVLRDGASVTTGLITDISTGGLAVRVAGWPGHTQFSVEVALDGESARLDCIAISEESTDMGTLLHCAFGDLAQPQREMVARLIEGAARAA